ncbi:MAG: hypothetical protein ACTSX6_00200 [Candidatus Heimdallarchaeaceae archaeon]
MANIREVTYAEGRKIRVADFETVSINASMRAEVKEDEDPFVVLFDIKHKLEKWLDNEEDNRRTKIVMKRMKKASESEGDNHGQEEKKEGGD